MREATAHPEQQPDFVVLTVFTCERQHHAEFVSLARDFLLSQARWQPGLRSVELLRDEAGEHIVTLARWQDRESFEAFKHSESGRHLTSFGLSLRPQILFLQPEASLAPEAAPERLGMAHR